MSDNPLNDLIRAQQSGLIGLQGQRITQLEAELRQAQKRIREMEEQQKQKSKLPDLKAVSC